MAHQSGYLSIIDAADLVTLRAGLVDFELDWVVRQLPIPRFGLTYMRHVHDVGSWVFSANFLLPSGVLATDIKAGTNLTLDIVVSTITNKKFVLVGIVERMRCSSPIDGAVTASLVFRGDDLLTYDGGHLIPNAL